jgi:hypothetical protein
VCCPSDEACEVFVFDLKVDVQPVQFPALETAQNILNHPGVDMAFARVTLRGFAAHLNARRVVWSVVVLE